MVHRNMNQLFKVVTLSCLYLFTRLRSKPYNPIMPPPQINKHALDAFCTNLQLEFQQYCKQQGYSPKTNNLIVYLIDRGLIAKSSINRYAIKTTFEELQKEHQLNKTRTVVLLAQRFNITPRSVWHALRKTKL